MLNNNKYFLSAIASYVIWGFLPIFFKNLGGYDYVEVIFYRLVISSLLIAGVLLLSFPKTKRHIKTAYKKSKKSFFNMLFLTTVGAALLAVNWVTYIYTINEMSIHTAAFGYMILPIITALLALTILKEKLELPHWVALVLSVISCAIIGHVDEKQVLYILAISFSYSFYLVSQRKNTLLPRRITLGLQMIVGSLLMLFLSPAKHNVGTLDTNFWLNVTVVAAFFTALPLLLNLYALNKMKTSQLSYLVYINPIISFLIGVTVYDEKMEGLTLVAYGFLAVAIIIFNWEWVQKIFGKKINL